MYLNCDFKHNLYIDGIQNGDYKIHRRHLTPDSSLSGHLANEN